MTEISQDYIDRAVEELLLAYSLGSVVDDISPAYRPRSVKDVRRIHDGLVERLGGHGGWKVGQIQPGQEPGCAPIPRNRILQSPASWTFPLNGPLEIEVEVAVSIGRDLTQARVIGTQDVLDSIEALHPAIEVVSPRLRNKDALPALTTMADLQGNAGLIVGPPRLDWQSLDLATLAIELFIDGKHMVAVNRGPSQTQLLASLTWLANHARDRGKPLCGGHTILTGARARCAIAGEIETIHATVHGLGNVDLRM